MSKRRASEPASGAWTPGSKGETMQPMDNDADAGRQSSNTRRRSAVRAASVTAVSTVVVAAIVVPLVAFGGIGTRTPSLPGTAPSGIGTLKVIQTLEPGGPMFIEGAIGYLEVRADGRVVERANGHLGTVQLQVALPPGTYQIVSYVRPCDGNCGF